MPEATVHKYCYLATRQNDVRTTWKSSVMETKSQPNCMQVSSHPHFRLSVASVDGAHHPRSDITRNSVSQAQILVSSFVTHHVDYLV